MLLPHFTNNKAEAERSYSQNVIKLRFEPNLSNTYFFNLLFSEECPAAYSFHNNPILKMTFIFPPAILFQNPTVKDESVFGS